MVWRACGAVFFGLTAVYGLMGFRNEPTKENGLAALLCLGISLLFVYSMVKKHRHEKKKEDLKQQAKKTPQHVFTPTVEPLKPITKAPDVPQEALMPVVKSEVLPSSEPEVMPKPERNRFPSFSDFTAMPLRDFFCLAPVRYVAFDLETTGLSPTSDEIVEIGAVRVENGVITDRFQTYINPGIPMPEDAQRVNGITDDMLADAPTLDEVFPAFAKFIGDDVLCAHNAQFDMKFIIAAAQYLKHDFLNQCADSLAAARIYYAELPNKKLVTVAKAAGHKIKNAHSAVDDAEAVAAIIKAMLPIAQAKDVIVTLIPRIVELLNISSPMKQTEIVAALTDYQPTDVRKAITVGDTLHLFHKYKVDGKGSIYVALSNDEV